MRWIYDVHTRLRVRIPEKVYFRILFQTINETIKVRIDENTREGGRTNSLSVTFSPVSRFNPT